MTSLDVMTAVLPGFQPTGNPDHAALVVDLVDLSGARGLPAGIMIAALVDALAVVIVEHARASEPPVRTFDTVDITRAAVDRLWHSTAHTIRA